MLNSGGLGGDFIYVFPLTSSDCLVISNAEPDMATDQRKTTYPLMAEQAGVDWINSCTNNTAIQKVLSKYSF